MYKKILPLSNFFLLLWCGFFFNNTNVDFTVGKSKLSFTRHTQIKLIVCLLNKKFSSTQKYIWSIWIRVRKLFVYIQVDLKKYKWYLIYILGIWYTYMWYS